MERTYPIKTPSSMPATGRLLYEHLIRNVKVPARANHDIWYAAQNEKLKQPELHAFRGDIPIGASIHLVSLAGKKLPDSELIGNSVYAHTLTGEENYVLVSDLAPAVAERLGIPQNARLRDKVFNSNFRPYEQLPALSRQSSELAALSVPKSISSWWAGNRGRVNYSERNVLEFLEAAFAEPAGQELAHILHGTHMAWCALAYVRDSGSVAGDIMSEFYGQNPPDFYAKDLGSVLPSMFYAAAMLGKNPAELYDLLGVEIFGAKEAAVEMKKQMLVA